MTVKLPKVAVLLAAYNGMRWIEDQVASILEQSGVEVTIYISVDTSIDGTEAWCARLATNLSNVILLPSVGRFGGASRNFFRLIRDVDVGNFEFFAFADQDDIWYADKLQRAVSLLEQQRSDAYPVMSRPSGWMVRQGCWIRRNPKLHGIICLKRLARVVLMF